MVHVTGVLHLWEPLCCFCYYCLAVATISFNLWFYIHFENVLFFMAFETMIYLLLQQRYVTQVCI